MEEAIASIILNYARQHNVIDTGFIDKAAVELAGLFQSVMRDNIVLHESASNILSGIRLVISSVALWLTLPPMIVTTS